MTERPPNGLLDYARAELPDPADPPLAPLTPTIRVVRWVLLALVLMLVFFASNLQCNPHFLNH